jgi:hypothetical protein
MADFPHPPHAAVSLARRCGNLRSTLNSTHLGAMIRSTLPILAAPGNLPSIGGEQSLISNCQKLDFDGNRVRSTKLGITQKRPKDFKKTKIKSCDSSSPTIRIYAPFDPKIPDKLERFSMQGYWFDGSTTAEYIREKYVMDNGREKGNGMLVNPKRVSAHRKGLGG